MLILNKTILERINSAKFLGVMLDQNINWNRHTARKLVLSENLLKTNMKFYIVLTMLHDIQKVLSFQPHIYGIVKRRLHVKQLGFHVKMTFTICLQLRLHIVKFLFLQTS